MSEKKLTIWPSWWRWWPREGHPRATFDSSQGRPQPAPPPSLGKPKTAEPKIRPTRWHWRDQHCGSTAYEGRYDQHEEIEPLIVAVMAMRDEMRFDPKHERDLAYSEVLSFIQGKLNELTLVMDEMWHVHHGEHGPRRQDGLMLTSMRKTNSEDSAAVEEMKRLHRAYWKSAFGGDTGCAHCVFCESPGVYSGTAARHALSQSQSAARQEGS